MPSVVLDQVSFAYPGGEPVLSQVSLTVEPGERLGLIGPNGSGKTTLLRLITGRLVPQQGRVSLGTDSPQGLSARTRARLVSLVGQDEQIPFAFTARQVVLMGRAPHLRGLRFEGPADLERAAAAMRLTGVDHLAARRLDQLSGGERKRVFIARALAQAAPIMLLDEPTNHLDLRHQVEIFGLLSRLSQTENLTVITAIHDLNLAARHCPRLVMLSQGRVFADGTPEKVLTADNLARVYGVEVFIDHHPRRPDTPRITL
jgi:iron complex transport system ATP-binding protein